MSTAHGRGLDAFPQTTHERFEREQKETTLAPYRHGESGRAPQAEFLAAPAGMGDVVSDAGTHAFVSGLGAGKTTALILRAWVNAEEWNPGELGMLVAPTVPALKNVVIPEMRSLGLLDVCEYHGPGSERPGIHTPSGSRIILESADNERKIDRLRGPNLAWFGMDEPRSIPEQAWDVLSGRLRVGQYRNAFTTTTPAGKNWVWERFYDDEDRDVRYNGIYEWVTANGCNGVFGVPSWLNPYNPDDYFDRLKREYSGAFYEQEVEGEFTKFEGLVYPWFDADNRIPHDDRPEPAEGAYDEVIYGVDWGFRNPAVVLALVRQGDRWILVDEFYESRCTDEDHADVAETMQGRWGPGTFYCDPSEPSNIETFRRRGLNAHPAENDVIPGLQHVAGMQDSLRVVDSCQAVINEFGQYQYKDGDEKDDPVKQNDHAMDALRYALFTHANPPGNSGTGTW
jgi:phage terminase large subunit